VTASLFCNSAFATGDESQSSNLVRILVADDHDIVCAGLERMIAAQGDMEVCGSAGTGTEAVEKAAILHPDVIILDMNMSGLNGLETTREIRREMPQCEVLLFTGIETDDLMRQAFLSGAKSFILKSDARTHLLDAIRALSQHKPYFTNKVSEVIFSRMLQPGKEMDADGPSTGRLTPHEKDLMRRLALGDSNREVAERLGVNLRTAEGHRAALMRKMNFDSLADLVRYAVRNGVIEV
jgi:two-component system response regulator NreC